MNPPFSWKQVLGNILALFSGAVLARVVSAVTLIIVARQLGPEAYGQYSASIAFAGLTSILFSLGLDGWLLYQGGKDQEQLHAWFTSVFVLKTLLGILWVVGLWILAPHLRQSSFPRVLIFLGSLSLWFEEIANAIWSAFKVRLRNDLTLLLMVLSQAAFLGAALGLACFRIQEPAQYMAGKVLAALLGVAVSGLLVVRVIGLRLDGQVLRTTLRGTLPFAASFAFTTIYGRADLTIVANELGEAAAGVYAPALTLTNTLFLIPAAMYGVILPVLSRSHAQGLDWIKWTSTRLIPIMDLLGIGLGIGLAWISHPLITLLYGTAFQDSGDVLALLSIVLALRCPSTALAAMLVAVGWQTRRVGIQALCAVLNIVLNLLVVHTLGVMGVAKVYIITEIILLLGHIGIFILWMRKRKPERSC